MSAALPVNENNAVPADERGSFAEQTLWKRLGDARDLDAFCAVWLALQCRLIGRIIGDHAVRGLIVLDPTAVEPRAIWPEGADVDALIPVVKAASEQRRGVVFRADETGIVRAVRLAFPVLLDGVPAGSVALEIAGDIEPHLRAVMRQLQWGTAWIRERLLAERLGQVNVRAGRLGTALDLVAVALEEEGFGAACRALVTEAALRFGCERVSVGFLRGGNVQVVAISHSAQFGRKMNLVRMIGAAMDEAVDQRAVLMVPARVDEANVTRAHAELAVGDVAGTILTLPLFVHDRFAGAITCEWAPGAVVDQDMVAVLDSTAAALAPILDEKRQNDRWLVVKAAEVLAHQGTRLLGPGYAGRKLVVLAALAFATLGYYWTAPYRVTSDAVVEGRVQRSLVAPFNGFIKDTAARAGDVVHAGQVLASLDDRDLVLDRLKWSTDRQRRVFEYERAMGDRNRADARIVTTQMEQAEAQIRLIDEQLARVKLTAPFDGLIVSGDLTQAIGAAVQRGQVLFEVAPLDSVRIGLDVDESQIADIAVGQTGHLVVASLPHESFPIVVSKITPVAKVREGHNVFRVEAGLDGPAPQLRPGMRGAARTDVDQRRVAWIWTRSFLNWLTLSAWRWSA